jgi:hypothetical protein
VTSKANHEGDLRRSVNLHMGAEAWRCPRRLAGSGCSMCSDSSVRPDGAEAAGWGVSPQLMSEKWIGPAVSALLVRRHRGTVPVGVTLWPSITSPGSNPAAGRYECGVDVAACQGPANQTAGCHSVHAVRSRSAWLGLLRIWCDDFLVCPSTRSEQLVVSPLAEVPNAAASTKPKRFSMSALDLCRGK